MWQRASDKRWCERVAVKPGGKREKLITAKTKAELNKKLSDLRTYSEHGRTFSESAQAWEDAHESTIEAKSMQSYRPHVKRATEHFEGQYTKDITPDEVQAFVDGLARKKFARDTVHRALVVLNMIFNYEIVQPDSQVRFNPCSAVKLQKGLPKKRREPPTEEQIVKVTPDSEMGLFAYFLLFTGLRRGELLGLKWEEIDFDNHVIHVRQVSTYASNQAEVKERAKTAAGVRDVALLDVLEDELKKIPLQSQKGYLFGDEKPLTATQFRKRWLSWCRSVGLAEGKTTTFKGKNGHTYTSTAWKPSVTPHQFRHEYASMLEDAGIGEFEAKNQLGHSSITVTKDIYTHIRERKAGKDVASKLNNYLQVKKK